MRLSKERLIAAAAVLALLGMIPLTTVAGPTSPDVAINPSDIAFSNDYPKTGETVAINITVHNKGETEATAVTVRFYTDQELVFFAEKDITRIAPNGTGIASTNWPATLPKTYTIYVKVDCTADLNLANNQAQRTITVTQGGVLLVDMALDPSSCRPGQPFWVNGTVRLGTQPSSNADVRVTVKDPTGNPVGTPATAVTDSGGNYKVNLTAPGSAMNYEVEVSATSGGLKGNGTKTLRVILPDLVVLEVTFSNNKPKEGEKVTLTALVKNNGTEAVDTLEVAFYIDNNRIATKKEGPLAPDNSTQVSVTWTATKGSHQVKVVIDPNAKVGEINEDNNVLIIPMSVSAKPGGGTDNMVMIFALVVVILVVAVGGVLFLRRRKKKE